MQKDSSNIGGFLNFIGKPYVLGIAENPCYPKVKMVRWLHSREFTYGRGFAMELATMRPFSTLMDSRAQAAALTKARSAAHQPVRTGEHCPWTGWWAAAGPGSARFMLEGSLMPAGPDGGTEVWTANPVPAPSDSCQMFEDQTRLHTNDPATSVCDDFCPFCSGPETD